MTDESARIPPEFTNQMENCTPSDVSECGRTNENTGVSEQQGLPLLINSFTHMKE